MGQLNVNPTDLVKAAAGYTDLAARVAQLPPLAVAALQSIAASHGPMGYPTAVGVAVGLASREPAVQGTAVQFRDYADRFTGHASTYVDADRAAAAKLDAIVFPQMHVDPKPPPQQPSKPAVVCWLPSPDADPAKYCPADTTRIQYVDGQGQWIQKDIGTGANEVILNGEIPGTQYLPGPPAGNAAPGITDRLWPDEHGNLVHDRVGTPNLPPKTEVLPPGRISW
jgi:excreted virulence factor EspC (type VII ESX diderm)